MDTINSKRKPAFHIYGGVGWINDPNGLIYYKGRWHAFFQYYPEATHWGPMHWGHVVSDDLINWERLPVALAPGGESGEEGCFSGSAIEFDGRLWLLYTGYTENGGGDDVRQLQYLASSDDGVNFVKHGIVIGEKELPPEYSPCNFRDPRVWKKDGVFYCLVAAKRKGGNGRIIAFRSENLFDWQFVGDLFGEDSKGSMTECPEYNDQLGLLTVCEQFQPAEGKAHLNVHSTRWYTGALDYSTFKFKAENCGIMDYGFDFYAPQSYIDRNITIGWLNMWDRNVPSDKYGFAGMLTFPRRIQVKDGALWQTPAIDGELFHLRETDGTVSDKLVHGAVKIVAEGLESLQLDLRIKGDTRTSFRLDGNEWVFDRSLSGEKVTGVEKDEDSLAGIRRIPYKNLPVHEITVISDEFSVEIFVDGEVASSTVYPEEGADGLELAVKADLCKYAKINM